MELLESAVVDLAVLCAAAHALDDRASADAKPRRTRERKKLRGELKRGVAAYVGALARLKQDRLDQRALDAFRVEAERQMPLALQQQAELRAMLAQQSEALGPSASVRHDLWRIAHLAIYLNHALRMMRETAGDHPALAKRGPARRLQRAVRRAMVKYVRALMRARPGGFDVAQARHAAVAQLDSRCLAAARALAQAAAEAPARRLLADGVLRPLDHLVIDWTEATAPPAAS